MFVSCTCDVHRLCALGFVEGAIPRAMPRRTSQITCPNLVFHEKHREVDLHPLLQKIRNCDTGRWTRGKSER